MLSIQICPLINPISVCARMHTLHHVWLFTTQWTVACQALLSMGFSRQEYWSGCHALLQGNFMTQESHPRLLHWRVGLGFVFTTSTTWEAQT